MGIFLASFLGKFEHVPGKLRHVHDKFGHVHGKLGHVPGKFGPVLEMFWVCFCSWEVETCLDMFTESLGMFWGLFWRCFWESRRG